MTELTADSHKIHAPFQPIFSHKPMGLKPMSLFLALGCGFTLLLQLSGLMNIADSQKEAFYVLQLALALFAGVASALPLWQHAYCSLVKQKELNRTLLLALGCSGYFIYAFMAAMSVDKAMIRHLYLVPASIVSVACLIRLIITVYVRMRVNQIPYSFQTPTVSMIDRVAHDQVESVTPNRISHGDVVRIAPGAYIPVDGIVTDGQSLVDEQLVYRKACYTPKMPGDRVYAGSMNGDAILQLTVSRTIGETAQDAQQSIIGQLIASELPMQPFLRKLDVGILSVVIILALMLALSAGMNPVSGVHNGFGVFVVLLLCACPIAPNLQLEFILLQAMKRFLRGGVISNSAAVLSQLTRASTLGISRRGTLVDEELELLHILPTEGHSETNMLRLTASLAQKSDHPLALTLVRTAKKRQIGLLDPHAFNAHPGYGISGIVDGRSVSIGNHDFMKRQKISVNVASKARPYQSQGRSVLYIAQDGQTIGIIVFASKIEKETYDAVKKLQSCDFRTVLLTGDDELTAQALARKLDIGAFEYGLSPNDRSEWLAAKQKAGEITAFMSGSAHDGPILSSATPGIFVCAREPMPQAQADINILSGHIADLAEAKKSARKMMRNVQMILAINGLYYALALSWAAGLWRDCCGLSAQPVSASLVMLGFSVLQIGLISQIFREKPEPRMVGV